MVTIGTDPEIILFQNGAPISSQRAKVPGKKGRPVFFGELGAIHRDNALLELNVPPSVSEDEFVNRHNALLEFVHTKVPGVDYYHKASVHYLENDLRHPEVLNFGCEPDDCVWGEREGINAAAALSSFRCAGGHVHIGYIGPTEAMNSAVVRACDLYLGLPSLFMDNDRERRNLYGQAGKFRTKPYGVEYRTLSNFWLWREDYMRWVFRNAKRAYEMADKIEVPSQVEDIINNYDLGAARALIEEFDCEVLYG